MFRIVGLIAPSFAIVFAFYVWDASKVKPLTGVLVIFVVALALGPLIAAGGGRRSLFGAALALPLCIYWRFLRNWKPSLDFKSFVTITALNSFKKNANQFRKSQSI